MAPRSRWTRLAAQGCFFSTTKAGRAGYFLFGSNLFRFRANNSKISKILSRYASFTEQEIEIEIKYSEYISNTPKKKKVYQFKIQA